MAIKSENYILIPGWAAEKLNLKGNDLLIYSIIYGFSQQTGQCFNGSLNYLQEWTQSTRQGVIKNLNNLIKRNLILKEDSYPTNKYRANLAIVNDLKDNDVNSVTEDVNIVNNEVNSVTEECKLSLQNNITNNIIIKKNKYKEQVELLDTIEEIISYFNTICNTKFKSNSAETKRLIKARINEGFGIEDFKKVIDCKYEDWGKTPIIFKTGQWSNEYLRPSTLFGNKFESYLHEAVTRTTVTPTTNCSVSAAVDEDRANESF